MRSREAVLFFLIGMLCMSSACMDQETLAGQDEPLDWTQKDDITIAIVDSGLGGLSILADAAAKLKSQRPFRRARLVFFNALFSLQGGYNSLDSREDKIRIFDSALESLKQRFSPDLILIGCNTLSSLYPDTRFSRQGAIPVRGIIGSGARAIASQLRAFPEASVIIFATQTTIQEGTHKRALIEKGFLEERIITQSCPDLIPYIEKNRQGEDTEMLIYAYVDEALQKARNHGSPLIVSLNCTHYGYSLPIWKKAFQIQGVKILTILNPNTDMAEELLGSLPPAKYKNTEVTIEVVSMVPISRDRQRSLGSYLKQVSPETERALADYAFIEDLFPWRHLIEHAPRP